MPQFVHADKPVALQYTILAVVAALMDILMMSIYAYGGRHAMRTLSARAVQWINRSCAGMLAFLAVGLEPLPPQATCAEAGAGAGTGSTGSSR